MNQFAIAAIAAMPNAPIPHANDAAVPGQAMPGWSDSEVDFRQLRHQTKNALSRIMLQLSEQLRSGGDAPSLAAELERRIMLTAQISDALFGFTQRPAPLPQRLDKLCRGMLDLLADPEQQIELEIIVGTAIPAALDGVILRVAHEFIGNAIKHGMHMRLCGTITATATRLENEAVLEVSDDGWGFSGKATLGEGMHVARHLAAAHDGEVTLRALEGSTLATLRLPVWED